MKRSDESEFMSAFHVTCCFSYCRKSDCTGRVLGIIDLASFS